MEKMQRCLLGALAGYATYLLAAWIYIAVLKTATGGSPDTYLPFVWPFLSPFLIFPDSRKVTPLDENFLSAFGGLLLLGAAIWGYPGFPRGKMSRNTQRHPDF